MPDRTRKAKRPPDASQLAKAIVDEAASEAEPSPADEDDAAAISAAVAALGRRGGLKGGPARAK